MVEKLEVLVDGGKATPGPPLGPALGPLGVNIVDESVFADRLERLAHRYPPASGARIERAWAGLYDMTPDVHPIVGRIGPETFAACGFSGHGFMQSPAVGRALAEEILDGGTDYDLSPFRLDRFEAGATFPEELVL